MEHCADLFLLAAKGQARQNNMRVVLVNNSWNNESASSFSLTRKAQHLNDSHQLVAWEVVVSCSRANDASSIGFEGTPLDRIQQTIEWTFVHGNTTTDWEWLVRLMRLVVMWMVWLMVVMWLVGSWIRWLIDPLCTHVNQSTNQRTNNWHISSLNNPMMVWCMWSLSIQEWRSMLEAVLLVARCVTIEGQSVGSIDNEIRDAITSRLQPPLMVWCMRCGSVQERSWVLTWLRNIGVTVEGHFSTRVITSLENEGTVGLSLQNPLVVRGRWVVTVHEGTRMSRGVLLIGTSVGIES